MNDLVIDKASVIAKELETRVLLRGYKVTAVLFGHGHVVVQFDRGGNRPCGQFIKKVPSDDRVS